jgi:hypothetical protein
MRVDIQGIKKRKYLFFAPKLARERAQTVGARQNKYLRFFILLNVTTRINGVKNRFMSA